MRTSTRIDRRTGDRRMATRITKPREVKAIIELNVADVKINLIGEHCQHCKVEHKHLLNLEQLTVTNH